jgi:D-3-phosphoglycerate dehydrogenase
MARVLVADPISQVGIDRMSQAGHKVDVKTGLNPDELLAVIGNYEALVVRSETKVTAQVMASGILLQVVGRAGVGIDNIDLDAATEHGIMVVNAPNGNTIAAAEHAVAMMLAMARNIPQADASLRNGEWRRSEFIGVELRNKNLGIIGLGKVGSEVARRAKAFQMHVCAYDPYVTEELALDLAVDLVGMDVLLRTSDFISIHTPLTSNTKQLLGPAQFDQLKQGVRIINAARGGLVDEDLLAEALEKGTVAGAALDVFTTEPPGSNFRLLTAPKAIFTPHLGASTEEAQSGVATEVADQINAILAGGSAPFTINVPAVPAEVHEALAPHIPVADIMARLAIQLANGQFRSVSFKIAGDIAKYDTTILGTAVLSGVLSVSSEERVNLVNARMMAKARGIDITEEKDVVRDSGFANVISVHVRTDSGSTILSGTSVDGRTQMVGLNGYRLYMEPSAPYMLFTTHIDRPGLIGKVGTITGQHDINISFMEVGREAPRGHAIMIVGTDDPVTDVALSELRGIDGVTGVKLVRL